MKKQLFSQAVFYVFFASITLFSCLPAKYIKPDNNVPGIRFTRLPTGTRAISGIYFSDEKNGYLWTIYGDFYRTTDGATNWVKIHSNFLFGGLSFLNETEGLGFTYPVGKSEPVKLSKTQDAWKTIQFLYELPPKVSCSNIWLDNQGRLSMFINKTIIEPKKTQRESAIYRFEDGNTSPIIENYDSLNIFSVAFADKNIGFADGASNKNQIILKTIDGGNSWKPLDLSSQGIYNAYSIRFMNGIGMISNEYKTTDKGQTWQRIKPIVTDGQSQIYFVNSQVGYAFGSGRISKVSRKSDMLQTYAAISITKDGGTSWYNNDQISIIPPITSVFFVNQKLAFGIAFSEDYYKGELIRIDITN